MRFHFVISAPPFMSVEPFINYQKKKNFHFLVSVVGFFHYIVSEVFLFVYVCVTSNSACNLLKS